MPSKLGPYNAPINVGRELRKRALLRGVRGMLRAIIAFARINPPEEAESEKGETK